MYYSETRPRPVGCLWMQHSLMQKVDGVFSKYVTEGTSRCAKFFAGSTMVHVSLIHRVLRIMSRSRHVTCAMTDFAFPTVRSLSTTSCGGGCDFGVFLAGYLREHRAFEYKMTTENIDFVQCMLLLSINHFWFFSSALSFLCNIYFTWTACVFFSPIC